MGLLLDLFSSKGVKRTLASIFAVAACVADVVPVLLPYREALLYLSGVFGAVGVTHAAIAPAAKPSKK